MSQPVRCSGLPPASLASAHTRPVPGTVRCSARDRRRCLTAGMGLQWGEATGGLAVAEHRREFDRQLDVIETKVIELFSSVCEDLPAVTQAMLNGNSEVAGLAERERATDALYREIEQLVSRQILLQAPVASDLRFLLSVLRITPELERSHDLVCHIASRVRHIPGSELSPRCRGLIERMDEVACGMWRWAERDGSAASALAVVDHELDELHARLVAELASGTMALPVTLEMTLVARF